MKENLMRDVFSPRRAAASAIVWHLCKLQAVGFDFTQKNIAFSQFLKRNTLKLWTTDFWYGFCQIHHFFLHDFVWFRTRTFLPTFRAIFHPEVAGLVSAPALAQEPEVGRAGPAVRNLFVGMGGLR